MCELLGLAFNEPVTAQISFRGFRHRGEQNPDGWGLAWFANGQAEIRKEPAPANTSATASGVQGDCQITSQVFIGHVRQASQGGGSCANTHPFRQDFRGGPVVFAHNGTLRVRDLPMPSRFMCTGQTDSEKAFCLLLSWMDDGHVSFSDYARIEDWLCHFNDRGTMNLLFSNGTEFFAYRCRSSQKGLCFTHRSSPFSEIKLEDEDWNVDLAAEKRPSEQGFVLATSALTKEPWVALKCGRLLVLRGGVAVYGDPGA